MSAVIEASRVPLVRANFTETNTNLRQFEVAMSPRDVARRLREVVQDELFSSKPFFGRLSSTSFDLRWRKAFRSPLCVRGEIHASEIGSVIEMDIREHWAMQMRRVVVMIISLFYLTILLPIGALVALANIWLLPVVVLFALPGLLPVGLVLLRRKTVNTSQAGELFAELRDLFDDTIIETALPVVEALPVVAVDAALSNAQKNWECYR